MRRGYADTPDGQVHYRRVGEGPPLVLLGSAGRSSRMFTELMGRLSEHYDVLGVDVLGSGASDPLPRDASMHLLARNLVHVLDALDIPAAHLFGLHTGNKIGSAAAARHADRLRSFVLCGQTHSIVADQDARNRGIGDRAKTYRGGLPDDHGRLVAWSMLSQRVSDAWWRAEGFSTGDVASAVERSRAVVLDELQSFADVPAMYELNFAFDMAAEWPSIAVPTLVLEIVTPREEQLYGRQGEQVAARIPGALLATMTAVGYKHTFEDRAQDLAEIIAEFCR